MHLWKPSATIENLRQRAVLTAKIRDFFAARQVMEVETPLLSHTTVSAPHILSIPANVGKQVYYLQTSPEYAMKRLLAAGSGSIYQICKAFRLEEQGHLHNSEFTIVEWYRLRFDHHALMDEVDALMQMLLDCGPAERLSYAEAFKRLLRIDPHNTDEKTLQICAKSAGLMFQGELDHDGWLQLLMSHLIEPQLGQERPTFIYDYPASQAALARIRQGKPSLASRFEVYYRGIELGNGFHELQDAKEQRLRFEQDLEYRRQQGLPFVPIDEHLLMALAEGLPDCAGIAMGVDRLVMLAMGCNRVEEVIGFEFSRA